MEKIQKRKMGSTSIIGKCHCEPIEHSHFIDCQTKKKNFWVNI